MLPAKHAKSARLGRRPVESYMVGDHRSASDPLGNAFAHRSDMRTALILAFAAAFAATTVACAVEQTESGSSLRKPSKKSSKNSSADDDEVDPSEPEPDSVGTNEVDPGNPNANSSATAPTGTGTAAAGFTLAVDNNTPTIDLASESTINVTITGKNGFTGNVALTVEGLPAGVTASPASGTPGSPIALKLKSTTSAPVTAKDGAVALTIKGTSGAESATAPVNFKVLPKITMTVPTNAQALIQAGGTNFVDEWGGEAFGDAQVPMKTQADNPIVVLVKNNDSTPRTIHGEAGFAHGAGNIAPGQLEQQNGAPRQRSFKPGANARGYLHGVNANGNQNAGVAVSFHLRVEEAP